jgi:hypothetical protein
MDGYCRIEMTRARLRERSSTFVWPVMRLHKFAAWFICLLVSGTAIAQDGYAYGADHCYHFSSPSGWAMNNLAGTSHGVPMVFYPIGETWESAETVMYTRPSPPLKTDKEPIQTQVKDVLSMYRRASENLTANLEAAVQSRSGAAGELWSYTGYSNGGSEFVVYFVGKRTVNYFVAQVPKNANLEKSKQKLLELASSYREGDDCKPCAKVLACSSSS